MDPRRPTTGTAAHKDRASRGAPRRRPLAASALVAVAAVAVSSAVALLPPASASAQAATGEPLFYPCTACHPTPAGGAPKGLPNGFEGHEIPLVGHDALGKGGAACLACHDSPEKDPGRLKLADGSLVAITGDVAGVCFRCHSDKHEEWRAGIHGKDKPKCTAAGCHDPHSPGAVHAPALAPFIGTGFQIRVLPEREPFTPLAPPAPAPPVETPAWLLTLAVLGVAAAASAAGSLAFERSRR